MAAREIIHRLKLAGEEFSQGYRAEMDKIRAESEKAGQDSGDRFAQGFKLKHAAIVAAAGSVGASIGAAINQSLDFAADLSATSKELGVGVERLQEWRYAASVAGVSANDLDGNVQKLTARIGLANSGNRDAQQSFVDLGVGFSTTSGHARQTEAVFKDVIQRLTEIEEPSERARVGAQLFGEQYQKLEPILQAGAEGFRQSTAEAGRFGAVMSAEEIKSLEKVNADLERMKSILSVRIAGVVSENADALIEMADSFATLANSAFDAVDAIQEFLATDFGKVSKNAAGMVLGGPLAPFRFLNDVFNPDVAYDGPTDIFGAGRAQGVFTGVAAEAARLDAQSAVAAPRVTPKPSRKTSRSGGSSSRRSGASAADREAERQAKDAARAEEAFADAITKSIRLQEDSAEVEAIRASLGEEAAAGEEARLAFLRQNPLAVNQTVEALADALGITRALTEADRERLQLLIDQGDQAERGTVLIARTKVIEKQDEEARRVAERQAEEMRRAHEIAVQDVADIWEDLFTGGTDRIWKNFKREGIRVVSEIAAQMTLSLISGQGGGNFQQTAGAAFSRSPLASIFTAGRTTFGTPANDNGNGITVTRGGGFDFGAGIVAGDQPLPGGGGIPDVLSTVASGIPPLALASAANALIGDILGFEGGPLGIFTGLFKKTKRGSATIGGGGSAGLGVLSTRGNSSSRVSGSVDAAGSVLDTVEQIAEALGGTVNSTINPLSLGIREGNYRVDLTGQGITKTKNGAIDFGADSEAAVKFAISKMLERGVVAGISDASKKILASGQDLEKAIEKAALIESVPKLLQQRLDPLNFALDQVYDKFKDLSDALQEGGASAEQLAQARQLWQLEREDTIKQIGAASSTLQSFLSSLTIGSGSPLSLRQQEAAAREALAPFIGQIDGAAAARAEVDRLKASGASAEEIAAAEQAARTAAGSIDQEGFQSAAQSVLGISRQINASSGGFFNDFDRIRALTGTAISLVDGASSNVAQVRDPFSEITAQNTGDMANMIAELPERIAQAINDNVAGGVAALPANWLEQMRGFANAG